MTGSSQTTYREAMKQGGQHGMQTFDESLYQLYASGRIAYQEAIDHADSRTDLALRIRLQGPQPGFATHDVDGGPDGPMRLEGMT